MDNFSAAAAAEALLTPERCVSRVGKLCNTMMNFDHLVRSGINSLKTDNTGKGLSVYRPQSINMPVSAAQLAERIFDDVGERFSGTMDWGRHTQMASSPRFSQTRAQEMLHIVEMDRRDRFERAVSVGVNGTPDDEEERTDAAHVHKTKYLRKGRKLPPKKSRGLMHSNTERFQSMTSAGPPPGHYRPRFDVVDKASRTAVIANSRAETSPTRSLFGTLGGQCTSEIPGTRRTDRAPKILKGTKVAEERSPALQPANTSMATVKAKKELPSIPFRQRTVPERAETASPINYHWPRHEPTARAHDAVNMARMVGRVPIATMRTCGPDAVYDGAQSPRSQWIKGGCSPFERQVARPNTMAPIGCGSVAIYDTSNLERLKFRKLIRDVTSFKTQTTQRRVPATGVSGDRPPNSDSKGASDDDKDDPDGEGDIPVRPVGSEPPRGMAFHKMKGREKFRPVMSDLSYDVNLSCIIQKSHAVLFRRGPAAPRSMSVTSTARMDDRQDNATTLRPIHRETTRKIAFSKMLGRSAPKPAEPYQNAEYNVDKEHLVDLSKISVRMATQLGRERFERGAVHLPYASQLQLCNYDKVSQLIGPRVRGALPFDTKHQTSISRELRKSRKQLDKLSAV